MRGQVTQPRTRVHPVDGEDRSGSLILLEFHAVA